MVRGGLREKSIKMMMKLKTGKSYKYVELSTFWTMLNECKKINLGILLDKGTLALRKDSFSIMTKTTKGVNHVLEG